MFDAGLEIADGLSQLSDERAATSHELHSDEAHNLAHHRTMRGAVYCSETLRLMSVQGQKATLRWIGQYPLIPFARRLRTAASCLSGHWSNESLIRPWPSML